MRKIMMKAQAEFAVIIGLVIIAAIVAVYAYSSVIQPSFRPGTISEEQKTVDSYVKDAVRRAALQSLVTMYNEGGYADGSSKRYVDYGGSKVHYWQMCSSSFVPDVEKNFEVGVKDILMDSLPERTHVAGKPVTFDKSSLSTDAELFDNKISLSVAVPTTVEGRPISAPYSIDIPSRLGRIYGFATDFTRLQSVHRALDYNLLRLIYRTNPKDCWLPTKGARSRSLHKSWNELEGCMKELIIHTLTHTYEWEKPVLKANQLPSDMMGKAWIFQVPKSDGTWGQYKELSMELYYGGEGRRLSRDDPELLFRTNPDPVSFDAEGFALLGSMLPPMTSYDVTYDVAFPVIVSVYDSAMERSFRFATFINIMGSEKSENCGLALTQSRNRHHDECVDGATKNMRLTVLDHSGDLLKDAVSVRFDSCGPWMALGGELDVRIPDVSSGKLSLYHPFSDSRYSMCADSSDLSKKNVTFNLKKSFEVDFYLIGIEKGASGYEIKSVDKSPESGGINVTAFFTRAGNACMNSTQTVAANYPVSGVASQPGRVDIYPESGYSATLLANDISLETDTFTVDGDETMINVNAPVMSGFDSAVDGERIKELYDKCSIDPVSIASYGSEKVGCSLP